MSKSPITCHVLDSSKGKPAQGVPVHLDALQGTAFTSLAQGETDADGRCTTLLDPARKLAPGGAYFARQGTETFYPTVQIIFDYAKPEEHYHIPLLLSPYSYTTYRGS
ncbi:hypothetical protein NliqN6_4821 [Naganishia liquefaciens]|uniref:5-hydroxyisourate hydrolase n=1 Tax=Naganishia liquefaciens TaxID=104408 RepID=A0A8H3YG74_9TREE|nr:hypothetical protein NliqN6_4821 [Naganishia liquefaciens]